MQSVPFNITNHQKVFIVLNRKALESPLIDVPMIGSVITGVIANGVSRRDPPQEIAHRTVPVRPQNELPMIGHQLKREQRNIIAFQPLGENFLEGCVVRVFAKMV